MVARQKQDDQLTHEFMESIQWFLDHDLKIIKLNRYGSSKDCKAPASLGWRENPGLTKRQAYAAVRAGHNLGWAPTGEHLVIDVDLHGDKNGLKTYDKFKHILPAEHLIPRVDSSRGGFHLYFRKDPDTHIGRQRLKRDYGVGVDIIANGMVVIPSSIHPATKLPYKFANTPDDIPFWTDELKDLLTFTPTHNQTTEPTLTSDELEFYLDCCDNEDLDYEEWFEVGCAIHFETGGEGFEIFDEWSALSGKHDPDITEAKWESMGNYGGSPITGATLQRHARENEDTAGMVSQYEAAKDFGAMPKVPRVDQRNNDPEAEYGGLSIIDPAGKKAKQTVWFMRGFIPAVGLTLFVGETKSGKSTISELIYSHVVGQKPWPGMADGNHRPPPGKVLYFNLEDARETVLYPRLAAYGVKESSQLLLGEGTVHTKKGKTESFNIGRHLGYMEEALINDPDIRLIDLDPINSFMPSGNAIDSYNDATLRSILDPLQHLAIKYNVAIVAKMHYSKNRQGGYFDPGRIAGGSAFQSTARMILAVAKHPTLAHHSVILADRGNQKAREAAYIIQTEMIDTSDLVEYEELDEKYSGYSTDGESKSVAVARFMDYIEDKPVYDWEREFNTALAEANEGELIEAQDQLINIVEEAVQLKGLEYAYWTAPEFEHFMQNVSSYGDTTINKAKTILKDRGRLHTQNVAGTWYHWLVDDLTEPDEVAVFNAEMENKIRREVLTLDQEILVYLESKFPMDTKYETLYKVFDKHPNGSVQKACQKLVKDGTADSHKKPGSNTRYIGAT